MRQTDPRGGGRRGSGRGCRQGFVVRQWQGQMTMISCTVVACVQVFWPGVRPIHDRGV